LNAWRAL
jgi:hypothetical protein